MKVWISIGEEYALIETRNNGANGGSFSPAAQIVPHNIKIESRPHIALLADPKIVFQTQRREARNGDGVYRDISVAWNNLKPATDIKRIERRLVNLHDHFLLRLIDNRPQRRNARVIEDAKVIEIAFRLKEIALALRLALADQLSRGVFNVLSSCVPFAEQNNIRNVGSRAFADGESDIYLMRIVARGGGRG